MHVIAVKRSLEGGVPHVDELHPVSELRGARRAAPTPS